MAEADHLHGLLTVQVVLALGVVDVQVLIGVVIVHLLRDIDVHPLQLVHQGHESLQVHIDVVVDGDAEGLLDLLLQHVHPRPRVGSVDLGVLSPVPVYRRIPGYGDHPHLLVGYIVADHDDGVGVGALPVPAQKDEIVHILPPLPSCGLLLFHRLRRLAPAAGGGGRVGLLGDLRRPDRQVPHRVHPHDHGG